MQVMTEKGQKTNIGLIGLAVMGENLALNMADKGWHVSVFNRTVPGVEEGVVERFINGRAKGKSIEGYTEIPDFVESISTPRKIMMMVGMPVPKKMLAGRPMMAWIWRFSTKFFLMAPSSPPRNSTPCGKTMHMMPSGRRWYRSCSKKA